MSHSAKGNDMHTTTNKLISNHPLRETKGRTIRWAHHYDQVVRVMTLGKDKTFRNTVAELALLKPGDTVLDVGCGTGDLTIAAKTRTGSTGKVYGIDAAPEMIDVARSKVTKLGIEIDFRVDLIERLSCPDSTFVVVLSSLMMHHLPADVKLAGLREIYRVLKPSGLLFVVDVKRPEALLHRVLMAVLLHPKIETGTQDLPTMLKMVGFTHIDEGNIRLLPMMGYVQGERGR